MDVNCKFTGNISHVLGIAFFLPLKFVFSSSMQILFIFILFKNKVEYLLGVCTSFAPHSYALHMCHMCVKLGY